jgi:hypothetical protein
MKDKKYLRELILNASETQVRLALFVLSMRRAWRIIPTLQPKQIALPASLLQMCAFIIAAQYPQNFITIAAIGNFIVVGIAILPGTIFRSTNAHWVRS